jgi:hypothetical protein
MAAVISNPTVAALYGAAVQESLEAAGFTIETIRPDGGEAGGAKMMNLAGKRAHKDFGNLGGQRKNRE